MAVLAPQKGFCSGWGFFASRLLPVQATSGRVHVPQSLQRRVLATGDHAVVMEPGYRQVRGCVTNVGATVSAFPLMPDCGWRPDLKALRAAITPETRLIAGTPSLLVIIVMSWRVRQGECPCLASV